MREVVTAILGGGQGTRLWPLTRDRAKPAVPVGGKFRLIDIPISNSLHASVDRVFVLTQFNSASLHRHIAQTYRFDVFSGGFVNILAAEQTLGHRDWYQGTADAVRQNLPRLLSLDPSEVLILSGDQLYLMDIAGFIQEHRRRQADLTVAVKPVPPGEAPDLGIMHLDGTGRIIEFVEKPKDPEVIRGLAADEQILATLGIDAEPGWVMASMGIYVFRPRLLAELLEGTATTDFGREVIPQAIHDHQVFGFAHSGYWRDIGTIPAFHQANLELTLPLPALDLYSSERPIYTHPRFLPGCKINRCDVYQSILADGTILSGSTISNSIVGLRSVVRAGSVIEESVLMGASHFEPYPSLSERIPLGIGRDCLIRRAIVDVDARIGDGCRLVNEGGARNADADGYCIREGVIVVPRGAELSPGTVI